MQSIYRWWEIIFPLGRYPDPIDKFRARGTYVTGLGLVAAGLAAIVLNLQARISAVDTPATQDNLLNILVILESVEFVFPIVAVFGTLLTRTGRQVLGAFAILFAWFVSAWLNTLISLTNIGTGISFVLILIGLSLASLLIGKRATMFLAVATAAVMIVSLVTGPLVSTLATSTAHRLPFLAFYLLLLLIQTIIIYSLANALPAVVGHVRAESANRLYEETRTSLVENERLNKQLTVANEHLQALDQLKSRFITDVSHELRTPLASLNLRLHLLQHDTPEKRDRHLALLQQQITKLNDILENILDFSQIEEMFDEKTNNVLINFNLLVEEVVMAYRARTELADLTINLSAAADLPQIVVDRNQMRRAIENLLDNAISYTAAGQVSIRTYQDPGGRDLCVEIQDTGIGIPPEDLPHLFDRFYRGQHVGSSNISGMGLGLSIVKEIVDRHQGRIEVTSELNIGSTFKVCLPLP